MPAAGRVVVVGQGYVGLPLAMRAVEVGFDVVGFDVDRVRVDRLAAGDSYVGDIGAERAGRGPREWPLPPLGRPRATSPTSTSR